MASIGVTEACLRLPRIASAGQLVRRRMSGDPPSSVTPLGASTALDLAGLDRAPSHAPTWQGYVFAPRSSSHVPLAGHARDRAADKEGSLSLVAGRRGLEPARRAAELSALDLRPVGVTRGSCIRPGAAPPLTCAVGSQVVHALPAKR